ncbi:uncharacterized protein B0J16DRAFT_348131 [Fusarium flagelliforme]|uniref:uncharacterized protein n=1 Tax=Fusarium flagelliforme TaxID=2675880 RepID=UPI001E8EC051|nr:uncharacterized protein B0J16DRAFT_348131 [Fusarium flagelliforme]KAH7180076.1 hypothetical protein B0J16DRAFT_348131 [Fusarium flagelliforme]
MQMHLLTHDDIKTNVFGHFKGVRAFLELNSLDKNGGDQLLNQVVSKPIVSVSGQPSSL